MNKQYMVQLDGLRFIAVFGVIFGHFVSYSVLRPLTSFTASAGVTLFFVLSGFLITQILLKEKIRVNKSKTHIIKSFYIRRFLRIFPLYYFVLFLALIVNIPTIHTYLLWYFTYTTNILVSFKGDVCDRFTHLWSLAVEEQFYIVFPFFVLFVPLKKILNSFYLITGIAIVCRLVIFVFLKKHLDVIWADHAFTPCCFDSFGIGAVLAYYRIFKYEALVKILSARYIFFSALLMAILLVALQGTLPGFNLLLNVFFRFSVSVFSFWLIGTASLTAFTGFFKSMLEHPSVVYLGKISYGLYVYHNFMPFWFAYFKINKDLPVAVNAVLYTIASVAIASLSWFLFEKPINDCKRFFSYREKQALIEVS